MKKLMMAMLLAAMLLAMCAASAMAAAPKIRKAEYEGNGVVEVDFTSKKVRYKGAKVVVKDADGNKLAANIIEKDSDDITFKVNGLKAGAKYTYTISGVRAGRSGSYGKVSGSFRTPSGKPAVKKVEYDKKDRELEVEFTTKVQFRNLKVTVADAGGATLAVKKVRKDTDEVEMKVTGMKTGQTYTVTVSGVRVKGLGSYTSVKKTFVA